MSKTDTTNWTFWAEYQRPRVAAAWRKSGYQQNPWYTWSKRAADNANRRVSKVSKTSGVTTKVILDLLAGQDYKCALSGLDLEPNNAQLDHIVPSKLGGPHTPDNVQILHESVNRAKSAMLEEEFVALCHAVVAHTKKKNRKKK